MTSTSKDEMPPRALEVLPGDARRALQEMVAAEFETAGALHREALSRPSRRRAVLTA
jgi:hypothetical protein